MIQSESKNESVKNIIEGIEKGAIALPEFQRDFVWDITKTYDLFDSLVRDIFAGAIIYGKPSFEIAVREIDTRPRKGRGINAKLEIKKFSTEEVKKKIQTDNFRIILDGQQRITSLYRALNDKDTVWFIVKNDSDYEEDEIRNKNFKDRTIEELLYEIRGEEDKERLSVKIGDVYKIMKADIVREKDIKREFFDNLKLLSNFNKDNHESIFDNFIIVVNKIRAVLSGEDRLLSYYLLDMSIDKFALFFERSNSKVVTLNFTDILAAKLYAGDFNLRDKIDEFEESNTEFKDYFNREIIIRTIAYIVGDGKSKIDRAYILKHLSK